MKAMVRTKYGSPEVLGYEEVEKPVPGDNEILVRIFAASVNALDWHFLRGTPFFLRFKFGLLTPKNKILGYDIAGRVEAVGKKVTRFRTGDDVLGGLGFGLGGFAEYACVADDGFIGKKPERVTFLEAAAIPAAAVAALIGICDRGKIKSGQEVLINGSAGGVGTFSVQIAKSFGGIVTGVCSTQNVDMVRSIGAERVVDYTKEDFTRIGRGFDLIVDNVGNRSVNDLLRVLNPGGRCVSVGFTSLGLMLQHTILGPLYSLAGKKIWVPAGSEEPDREHMTRLVNLIESGTLVPVIDRIYPLTELPDAIRYIETGHARGKVVINIADDDHP